MVRLTDARSQLGNSAVHQSHEKRLFEDKDLFGLVNLLGFVSTNDIIMRANEQYELVSNRLAEEAPPGTVLDSLLSSHFDELQGRDLFAEDEPADERGPSTPHIAGVLYTHNTRDLVGDDGTERELALRALSEMEQQKRSVAERMAANTDPAAQDEALRDFRERKRRAAGQ